MYCVFKLDKSLSYQKAFIALLGNTVCTFNTELNEISHLRNSVLLLNIFQFPLNMIKFPLKIEHIWSLCLEGFPLIFDPVIEKDAFKFIIIFLEILL